MALSRSRTVAGIGIVVALALILGPGAALSPATDLLTLHSTLTLVDGDVLVSRSGADFSAAHEGDVLVAGDTLRIGARASAQLTYFEGSSVVLEPETEIVVERLASEPDGGKVFGALNTLERTWYVVTKVISGGSRYEIRTPSSTASVRG